jgi:ABC-2 type transport system ATP-binding protein
MQHLKATIPYRNNSAAEVSGVTKRFGSITAISNVSIAIPQGFVMGLLGPNGAGKTTLVRLLLGMVRPDYGRVAVFGNDPILSSTRTRTGAMLQVSKVPETLRVLEHLQLFRSYYPRPLPLKETLRIAGLESVANRLFGELSGGQKQRVMFALAICGNPDLVLLDEPTVGLDVEARRAMWQHIRDLASSGKTILLTTHYLEEADALSDEVVILNQGAIVVRGTPREIKATVGAKFVSCVSALSADEVRLLPGVIDANRKQHTLQVRTSDPDVVIRTLLARDPSLHSIEVTATSLDDAFLALTQATKKQFVTQEVMQ